MLTQSKFCLFQEGQEWLSGSEEVQVEVAQPQQEPLMTCGIFVESTSFDFKLFWSTLNLKTAQISTLENTDLSFPEKSEKLQI